MIRPFLAILVFVYTLSWCSSCSGLDDDPKPNDTIPEVDSTAIYPLCIPDTTRVGQLFGCTNVSDNIFFGRVIHGDLLYPDAVLTVVINPKIVAVTNKCQAYQLPHDGFQIQYLKSGGHVDSVYFSFCEKIPPDNSGTPLTYNLESGRIIIASDKDSIFPSDDFFKISAQLFDAKFGIAGSDTLIKTIIFNELPISIPE